MANQPQSVEELVASARAYSPEERGKFLDRACANAPEVRRHVEELLLAGEPLPETIPGVAASTGRFAPEQVIAGRFVVVRFIAHGGMGEVYEVEDKFLQSVHVALKVVDSISRRVRDRHIGSSRRCCWPAR